MSARSELRLVIPAPRAAQGVLRPLLSPVSSPVVHLAARLAPLCAGAVDPLEVAAGLEAEGVNDSVAQRTYGATDVFALAERLYIAVPRRPPPPPAVDVAWRVRPGNLLVRTAVFALPGLPFVASARLLAGPGALVAVLVSLVLAWVASETLSYLGAAALGRAGRAGGAAVLRRCAACASAVVVPAAAVAAFALGAGPVVTAYAGGQAVYLLAATVLLVLGAENRLLAALLPVALVSVAALLGALPVAAVGVAAGATVLGVLVLAVAAVWTASGVGRPRRADLAPAAASALFGLLAACLVTFGAVAALVTGSNITAGALTALPITLSMGVAEGLLVRFRRSAALRLTTTSALRPFGWAAARTLMGLLAAYLAVLTALAAVMAAGPVPLSLSRLATSVLLGGALFLALLLRSFGFGAPVLAACAAALGLEAALVLVSPLAEPGASAVLLAVLMGMGLGVLTRASAHR